MIASTSCRSFLWLNLISALAACACARSISDDSDSSDSSDRECYADQLLLVSMDGFKWDYLDKAITPNFDWMIQGGTKAAYVTAPFATLTFPSHYTIVTGLYEENHGIVNNFMYDPVLDKEFGLGTTDTEWWDGAEPIWINVRKNNLKSGTYFWSGSETKLQNMRANIWLPYEHTAPFTERIDTVVEWLADFKLNLVTLYFHEPDSAGHRYGPDSAEVLQKVEEMDELLGYLLREMNKRRLLDRVNIIVTSDHGMTETIQEDKTIELNNYLSPLLYNVTGRGATAQINPKTGFDAQVYDSLKNAHPNLTVYWRDDIPDRWHYKHHHRIPDILAVADEGWYIRQEKSTRRGNLGSHGYDNNLESMRTIFVARGPNIRKNYRSRPFELVSVYPLMCELLGIPPAPNNGSLTSVRGMLQNAPQLCRRNHDSSDSSC